MKIMEKTCQTALSDSKLPGLTYALNPYEGCSHQCAYCYVPSVCHLSRKQWENHLFIKRNIPLVLSKELPKKKKGIVGISTVTDPYQPIEETYQLTRYCLEQLLKKDFPISIQTKSSLVIRDKDLIQQFSNAELMMSIATFDENKRILLEPGSSSIKKRLQVFKTFSDNIIKKSVFMGPLYPMKEKELKTMLDTFIDLSIQKIMIDYFRMKPGLQKNIEQHCQKNPFFLTDLETYLNNQKQIYNQRKQFIQTYLKNENIDIVDAF